MLNRYLLAPLAALLLLAAPRLAHAQTGGVRIGTAGAPDASAALDIVSTSKGLLPPRLSTAQRDAIASPAAGLTIYNTTTGKLNTWNGTSWDTALSATEPAGTFAYTGGPQTYTVPAGVFRLRVDARGGAGGASNNSGYGYSSFAGGGGARVQATLAVVPGQVLTLYVGGSGSTAPLNNNGQPGGGGYNGGGSGGQDGAVAAGGGGGASDVRMGSAALADRLLVAAGGGGGGYPYNVPSALGGAGGAPTGGTGTGGGGAGATPTGGNALGQGGSNTAQYDLQAGGGGGYYGGQASTIYGGGGGGGSSFVTTTGSSAVTMTAGTNAGNGVIVLTSDLPTAAPVLDGSNFVNVPGDNLGNHMATQNLDLNTYQLVGNGGSTGLRIASTGAISMAGNATVNGQVGIGTTPAASAALDVSSTTKGLLPPRMTTTQRDAIAGPAVGLTVYNTTTKKLNTWDGTRWDEALSANQQTFQAGQAVSFGYTGGAQTYTVPAGVTSLQVDASGAQGGTSLNGSGGLGARVQATIGVTPGQVLQINIGGSGSFDFNRASAGGYNGGGSGVLGASGGGATDIRVSNGQLTDRLLVAGGGGGGGGGYASFGSTQGGAGGDPTGGNGTYADTGGQPNAGGSGATQTSGGNAGGALGTGGAGKGGGGGGYYGGGGAASRGTNVSTADGGGGGGSSWTTPSGSFGITMTAGYQSGNGSLTLTPVVYPAPAINGANIVNVAGTWNVNGADVYRLGGNVGIGTSSPSATLDVSGSSSTVKLGGLAGTGTRMVTAAANGTLATQALPTDAQQLSISGSNLSLTNGGSVALPGDAQQLSKAGSTISLTNGGSVTDADVQQLSISGTTLSLTNGGSVTVPSSADNLGNHTATQNLNLADKLLVGNGGSAGLSVSSSGSVGIGTTAPPATTLDVRTADNSAAVTVGNTAGAAGALYLGNTNHGLKRNYSGSNDVGLFTTGGSLYLSAAGSASTTQFALTSGGNVGVGTPTPSQKLDVRGNLRLGDDNTSTTFPATGQTIEFVGPNFNTDPVGLYRVNPASDQSELRVVVGDVSDINDKFVVGRSSANAEGGIPTGTFTPNFTVRADGNVGVGTSTPTSTLQVAGSVAASIRTLSSGTIADNDFTVLITGNVSIPAPSAANTGRLYHIINGNGNPNTITGTFRDAGTNGPFGIVTLNSTSTNRGLTVQSDGTQWWILSRE